MENEQHKKRLPGSVPVWPFTCLAPFPHILFRRALAEMETETDLAAEAEGPEAEPSVTDENRIEISDPLVNLEPPPEQQLPADGQQSSNLTL